MSTEHSIDRREFLAASAAAGIAATVHASASAQQDEVTLALDGGPKAVSANPVSTPRFGEPERSQLDAMLGQDSLLYWKAPQTTKFIERFQEICPLKYVMTCSSGTAALHIAVCAAGIG